MSENAPHYGPMTEQRAAQILRSGVQPDGGLDYLGGYYSWTPGDRLATLDGDFTADELEAIAWWMRNKA